jgi:alcohol dehydrogenase, propanol-preferring
MKAMLLTHIQSVESKSEPLKLSEIPIPVLLKDELLIRVLTCGICHTELDEIEGRTPPPSLPIVPGHQVVGHVEIAPPGSRYQQGDRVGVAWIYSACGQCEYCLSGQENLCQNFTATGRDRNGGYAQYMAANRNFVFPIPASHSDSQAAPLLCAGAIGFRSLRLANIQNGQSLGLAGFGASAHLVLLLAKIQYPDSNIFVFSRSEAEREFALELGAHWAGNFGDIPPTFLHAAIDTTPAWKPIMDSLRVLAPGGRLVINAIRKEDKDKALLAGLDYPTQLWLEKEIKSVANVSRYDVSEFLALASRHSIYPEYQEFSLVDANQALIQLKERKIKGAKVLKIE